VCARPEAGHTLPLMLDKVARDRDNTSTPPWLLVSCLAVIARCVTVEGQGRLIGSVMVKSKNATTNELMVAFLARCGITPVLMQSMEKLSHRGSRCQSCVNGVFPVGWMMGTLSPSLPSRGSDGRGDALL